MKGKRNMAQMLIPTIIMAILAIVLTIIAYRQGQDKHLQGMRSAGIMTIQVLPLLLFSFIVAGMMQALIPHELISKWVGSESGWRGIFIGSVAGGLAPGGPYVSLPIAAGFMRGGAGLGTMVAFLTGWSIWAVNRLPMEAGIMGLRFMFIRLACSFFFPPIAGFLAYIFFERAN